MRAARRRRWVGPVPGGLLVAMALALAAVAGCGSGKSTGSSASVTTPANFDFGGNDPRRATAFGDSITFGVLELAVRDRLTTQNNYPNLLQGMLRGLDPTWRVVNRGVPGELSTEGARRLPAVLGRDRPGFVLIMHGTNDAARGVDAAVVVGNLETMVSAAQGNRSIPVLATIPPNFRNDAVSDAIIAAANPRIRALAQARGVVLADVFNGMNDRTLWGLAPNRDPLHPNERGYSVLAGIWFDAVQRAQPAGATVAAPQRRKE